MDAKFGFADVNEDVSAYGLLNHPHVPEMTAAVNQLSGKSDAKIVFTPQVVPMTRGILATCYLSGNATTEQCLHAAGKFYAPRPFVRRGGSAAAHEMGNGIKYGVCLLRIRGWNNHRDGRH